MNENFDRLFEGQIAGPGNDEFLGFAIEISLPKWEWIEGMKKLRDFIDTEFDHLFLVFVVHISSSTALPRPIWAAHGVACFAGRQLTCFAPNQIPQSSGHAEGRHL